MTVHRARVLAVAVLAALCVPAAGEVVRLSVTEPAGVARTAWPVTSGVPLGRAAVKDHRALALFAADGKQIPLQTQVLSKWPDGSVRWVLLDFQTDLKPRETKRFELRYGPGVTRAPVPSRMRVSRQDGDVTVSTGPMRVRLSSKAFRLLDAVWLGSRRVTGGADAGIVLKTPDGKAFRADGTEAELTIEEAGPVRACVRIDGKHAAGEASLFRYVVRVHAFAGLPVLKVCYTFINDHADALMAKVDSLNLAFTLADARGAKGVLGGAARDQGRLMQVDEQPAAGWAAVGSDAGGLAVGVREFRQNWPKALAVDARRGRLDVGILPTFEKGLYDGRPLAEENKLYYWLRGGVYTFKVGVARTHELWVRVLADRPDPDKLGRFFRAAEEPLLATCEPAHVAATKVFGPLPPAGKAGGYAAYDEAIAKALTDHLRLRDRGREYGMLNYGDWFGERGVNWGNLEYDLGHGMFLQYLRTGDRRYFLRGEQAARHHVDVDVVHATNKHLKNPWGPPPQVGEIWLHCLNHTGGYYQNAPLPVSRTYQMGHSTNFGHVWVAGDLDYYYLTGDRRARTVGLRIADAMVRHCPPRYGDHIRALGWPMILVLAAYDLTGEAKYLEAATSCWQVLKKHLDPKRGWVVRLAKGHCLHPDRRCHGNVPFMEGLVCCALARYHRITKDPEVLKAISTGIDQMIRECWLGELKTFRYTACPLSPPTWGLFALSAETMAYEIAHTQSARHRQILRDGLRAQIAKGISGNGKAMAQVMHFTPHALGALAD